MGGREDPNRDALLARRRAMRGRLDDPAGASAEALGALADLDAAIRAHDDRRRAAELESLVSIHGVLADLREGESPSELIDAAPGALIAGTEFTRAMISRVQAGTWDPVVFTVRDGIDPHAPAFQEYITEIRIPLEQMRLETEMARRRIPLLVTSPLRDRKAFKVIVALSRTASYVAAPIISTQRVIGFLHADRYGTGRACDAADRDALWVFAEHFALLFERAVFIERLEHQRREVQRALNDAAIAVDELCERELALARGESLASTATSTTATATATATQPSSIADALLTAREREILDGLATGITNANLARQLVLSEATIKSHLKRINRKLRTNGRAGAVARYLQMSNRAPASR